jgi:hypothetical protein
MQRPALACEWMWLYDALPLVLFEECLRTFLEDDSVMCEGLLHVVMAWIRLLEVNPVMAIDLYVAHAEKISDVLDDVTTVDVAHVRSLLPFPY